MEADRLTPGLCVAVAAACAAAELAVPAGPGWLATLDAAVGIAFAAGAAAARSPLALTVAVAWVAGTLAGLDGLPAYVAAVAVLAHRGPLALLLLAYPGARVRGAVPLAAGALALAAPFAPVADGPRVTAVALGIVALVVAAGAVRTPAPLRAPRTVAAVAAVAIALAAALGPLGAGPADAVLAIYDAVLLAAAGVLLVPLATGRWRASAASGLVVELGAAPPGAPVTARLAEVLRDPGLELRLRRPDGPWTDEAGRPAAAPAGNRRGVTRRTLADGTEVALLHDPVALGGGAAADSAVAVAATALENADRDRELRGSVERLRGLRRGLLGATDEERRLLEAELRSGPLREVDEVDRLLETLDGTGALRHELALAREDLLGIARGLYPAELARGGLIATLEAMAARSPVPVTVDARAELAVPDEIALTAYYVAAEALANVTVHSGASRARIALWRDGDALLVRVADDGAGGADPSGGGLSGLVDRVRAVGGELAVTAPPEGGTVIEARLPLAG